MAEVTVNMNRLNVSAQVGDTIWTTLLLSDQSGSNHPSVSGPKKMIRLGVIVGVGGNTVTYEDATGDFPNMSDEDIHDMLNNPASYFFFTKNQMVNSSGISGYYASVEYRNYSKKKAEIFATGTNYAPSSK